MTRKYSPIKQYLLQFDFLKKVIFVLGCAIIASLILIINVLLTYFSLTSLLQRQITGLDYHRKAINIYETVINVQSLQNSTSEMNEAHYEAQLITTISQFTAIANDLKNYIQFTPTDNENLYFEKINGYELKFQSVVNAILQDQPNLKLNKEDLKDLFENLKDQLNLFMVTIVNIFDLELYTHSMHGLQGEILYNKLPSFQSALTDLLSTELEPFTQRIQAEIFIHQDAIDDNLNAIMRENENFPDDEISKKNNPFENFLTSALNFSNVLELIIYQEDSLKHSWKELQKLGHQTLRKSNKLYNVLSEKLRLSLSEELHIYHIREIVSVFLFFLGTFLVLTPYCAQAFRRPLADIKKAVEQLTGGDLSVRIPVYNTDEVGAVSKSFNEIAEVFEKIMHETDHFALHLSKNTSEIFSATKKLEQNLEVQETAVQTIVQNSKNIVKVVHDFSNNLDQVNNTIHLTAHEVIYSQMSLNELEAITLRMSSSAENMVTALSSIKSEINKITSVINTLIAIADQINLLSLNTSIRASKTGLKKLGYTLIADKIKELADQTALATLNMEQIVEEILAIVPDLVRDIDLFGQEIHEIIDVSLTLNQQFQQLLTTTQTQIFTFQSVNKEMQDQAEKTTTIEKTINDLSYSTQKTIRSVRSLYVEIEYLLHSTKNLHDTTKKFI